MKTCSFCGAPQADTEPFCACCGKKFPGVKKRIHPAGIIGLVSALLSIPFTVFVFYAFDNLIDSETLREIGSSTVLVIVSLVGAITLPFLGFAISIKSVRCARDPLVTGKTFGITGIVISSIMSVTSLFFMFMVVLFFIFFFGLVK